MNPSYITWKEQSARDFLYIKEPFISASTAVDKPVIFGHTKTIDIHGSAGVWFGDGKIGIDGGCAYGYQLNCLEILADREMNAYHVKAD
ncbi:hypothetical protein [Paenibacillus sacheonensis]|uniref:hypothetical protein n=1 Tax=Paenibacillus sacheonensis TaxID=742054 RepID=UPI001EF9687A|nr:hypothetical protein [Paenibacillus sacheonensis]MBM7568831.1 hypothetical protein [Paenibacillus sacheonensis]